MEYRAVKANDSNIIIAIGADKGQGGQDYWNGHGTWLDFTFTEQFNASQELLDAAAEKGYTGSLLVVDDNALRLMTVEEIPS